MNIKKKERGAICFTCCCFQGQYDLDPIEMKKTNYNMTWMKSN